MITFLHNFFKVNIYPKINRQLSCKSKKKRFLLNLLFFSIIYVLSFLSVLRNVNTCTNTFNWIEYKTTYQTSKLNNKEQLSLWQTHTHTLELNNYLQYIPAPCTLPLNFPPFSLLPALRESTNSTPPSVLLPRLLWTRLPKMQNAQTLADCKFGQKPPFKH